MTADKITINLTGAWESQYLNEKVIIKREKYKFNYFIDDLVKNNILKIENGEILGNELLSLKKFRKNVSKA